jgi:hypothetical protein
MSAGSLRQIREAIADQLANGLDRETNTYPYALGADAMRAPYVVVMPPGGDYIAYYATMGDQGTTDLILNLHIVTASTDPMSCQIALDDYLSIGGDNQSSVVDAMNADRTLGGVVGDCVALKAINVTVTDTNATAVVPLRILFRKDIRA